jgi:hypothetical protein
MWDEINVLRGRGPPPPPDPIPSAEGPIHVSKRAMS